MRPVVAAVLLLLAATPVQAERTDTARPVRPIDSGSHVQAASDRQMPETKVIWPGITGYLGDLGLIMVQRVPVPPPRRPAVEPIPPPRPTAALAQPAAPKSRAARRQVLRVERLLRSRGYAVGVVDGRLDTRTAEAIRRYQRRYRLPVTGSVDTRLLQRLNRRGPVTRRR